ncbi:MAG: efflux RND transporter periplasmic adaptor subunit [Bacteroidetes bacterium]|nr:efflux RND transporter periplasmic adaptor subunit [Bacteroidota bacterium]MBU2636535.1 efflux RND transporter periplasmic adaptor subunit [Bacteroidota bacterium]
MKRLLLLFFLILICGACSDLKNDKILLSGTLEAVEATISSKVSGEVVGLLVNEGNNVTTGDTLAILDRTDYEIQYRQALAAVRVAEAQLALLVKGTRKEDLEQAEEALKQAGANFENVSEDYRRAENLFSTNSISVKQMDDAKTRFTIAQAQYNSAKQLLEKLKSGARSEEIDAAKARFDQAVAQADGLKKKVSDCSVLAPISGYVTKRMVEKGELAGAGMPMFHIANLDEIEIMVYLPETQLGKVQLGNKADVTIDSFLDKNFPGEVVYISPEAEFTPKHIQTKEERVKLVFGVKVKVPNPDHILKAGLPADVSLSIDDIK